MTVVGILAFVVALLTSVMLHEAGHFITARRYGMKATQFFFGFGPTLFSRHKGETEYGAKAIPLGGFVKIAGMTPMEEVEPGDEDRAFYKYDAGRKTVVLASGAVINVLLSLLIVFVTILGFGVPDEKAAVLASPQACVPLVSTLKQPGATADPVKGACPKGTVPGAAAAAGIRDGDRIVSVDGKAVADYLDFRNRIRASAGRTLSVVLERDGQKKAIELTPVVATRDSLTKKNATEKVGAIGVAPGNAPLERVGFGQSFAQTGTTMKLIVTGVYESLTSKLDSITKVYSDDRDKEGFIGLVGASRISGEIIQLEIPLRTRIASFLIVIAGLNLFVGVFNLLPLPPLDGGHIAVAWFESVRDRIRRARGYVGEIQRVDYNKLLPVTLAVVIFFAGFTVWLLGADIVNPVRLGQ
jgi:membrane-associated protease RseP (regulator of RpoE activity)